MQSAGPLFVTLLRAATPLGHGGLLCTGGQGMNGLSLVAQGACSVVPGIPNGSEGSLPLVSW